MRRKLESILLHIMATAGREVSRTEVMKMLYLSEIEYRRLYGESMTDVMFVRYRYGPYSQAVMDILDVMVASGIVECRQIAYSSGSYKVLYRALTQDNDALSEQERFVVERVVSICRGVDLNSLKELTYSTPPMKAILVEEERKGIRLNGRPLDMSEAISDRKLRPLSRIRQAARRLDLQARGSIEELPEGDYQLFVNYPPLKWEACGPRS